jgi:dGTPase
MSIQDDLVKAIFGKVFPNNFVTGTLDFSNIPKTEQDLLVNEMELVTDPWLRQKIAGLLLMIGQFDDVRRREEIKEYAVLHPFAAFSREARFLRPYKQKDNRTIYQRDSGKIVFSEELARLKGVTQVVSYADTHKIHQRQAHTLEVANIAKFIATALNMNDQLAEAGAYGHDIGHTPFGHAGERAINALFCFFIEDEKNANSSLAEVLKREGHDLRYFSHNIASGQILESLGCCFEVINCAYAHDSMPPISPVIASKNDLAPFLKLATFEAGIVRHSDKIAYLTADLMDMVSKPDIYKKKLSDVPDEIRAAVRNKTGRDFNKDPRSGLIDLFKYDFVETTKKYIAAGERQLGFSEDVYTLYDQLKKFNTKHYYSQQKFDEFVIEIVKSYYYQRIAEILSIMATFDPVDNNLEKLIRNEVAKLTPIEKSDMLNRLAYEIIAMTDEQLARFYFNDIGEPFKDLNEQRRICAFIESREQSK